LLPLLDNVRIYSPPSISLDNKSTLMLMKSLQESRLFRSVRFVMVNEPVPTVFSNVISKELTVKVESFTKDKVFTTPVFSLFIDYLL